MNIGIKLYNKIPINIKYMDNCHFEKGVEILSVTIYILLNGRTHWASFQFSTTIFFVLIQLHMLIKETVVL